MVIKFFLDTLKLRPSTHVNEVEVFYPASLDIICQDSNMYVIKLNKQEYFQPFVVGELTQVSFIITIIACYTFIQSQSFLNTP